MKKAIWAKDLSNEMNLMLAFRLDFDCETELDLTMTASSCYKVYADGKFVAFGPQRAAHGFARVANYRFCAKHVVVEATNLGVLNFSWVKQQPFFACELKTKDGKVYDASDFTCYHLTDRVKKVQRYSYQRGFVECYKLSQDRESLYLGTPNFPCVETEEVQAPKYLTSYVDEPKYVLRKPETVVETGLVEIDENAKVWRHVSQKIQGHVEGFPIEEWEDALTDFASKCVYRPNEIAKDGEWGYKTYDFGKAYTGFLELEVVVEKPTEVYCVYDEILYKEAGRGENYVDFNRLTSANIHKWTFEQAGRYRVSTFEPYVARYACIVTNAPCKVQLAIRDYENPNADRLQLTLKDPALKKIGEAARSSLAQNTTDVVKDCPSRECGGWLCDGYFISQAEYSFTGENQAEKTFLENFLYFSENDVLPKGLVPCIYPADFYDFFIPNWSMWYVLQITKYAEKYGKDELVKRSENNVRGVINFFEERKNEFGVLEDLDKIATKKSHAWVFIEWSDANNGDHVCGVSIPSNLCYASILRKAGEVYGESGWIERSNEIINYIKENAFDGLFLVDNLLRDENGNLKHSGKFSEVCQYYAYWFDCISKEEYPELFKELVENFGASRDGEAYESKVRKVNAFMGLYMRMDLLMRAGEDERLKQECIDLFLPMAERSGALWEYDGPKQSCVHGFASYAIKWIEYLAKKAY